MSGEYRDAPGTPDEALVWIETPRSDWQTVSLLLLIVVAVSAGLILATITGSPTMTARAAVPNLFELDLTSYVALVGKVVEGRCIEHGITHPGDVAAQFADVADALGDVYQALRQAHR